MSLTEIISVGNDYSNDIWTIQTDNGRSSIIKTAHCVIKWRSLSKIEPQKLVNALLLRDNIRTHEREAFYNIRVSIVACKFPYKICLRTVHASAQRTFKCKHENSPTNVNRCNLWYEKLHRLRGEMTHKFVHLRLDL